VSSRNKLFLKVFKREGGGGGGSDDDQGNS